jgi:hypothetical protein
MLIVCNCRVVLLGCSEWVLGQRGGERMNPLEPVRRFLRWPSG